MRRDWYAIAMQQLEWLQSGLPPVDCPQWIALRPSPVIEMAARIRL